jgi:predicted transcriptional regulator
MLVQNIIAFLEKRGISTIEQIANALDVDYDTMILKLSNLKVIKSISPAEPCCKDGNGCGTCSITKISYYSLY